MALQLPSPLLRADPLQSPSGLTHGVSDREPICDAGCSQGDQKIEAKSTLSPNPNLQVLFFLNRLHIQAPVPRVLFFLSAEGKAFALARQGSQRKQKEN